MCEAKEKPTGYRTMSEDATKEQREADGLEKRIQTLSFEQLTGLLCFLLGVVSTKPEWPVLKEAVELYLKEYGV